jgi:hypothetical protein
MMVAALALVAVVDMAAGVVLVRRARVADAELARVIAEHRRITGDAPTVAELRAGLAGISPAGEPIEVSVTVLDATDTGVLDGPARLALPAGGEAA